MMNPRFRPTGPVFFTLLAAMASPLHGEVPGELGVEDVTGIREAHRAARWSDGLTGENPVELDPTFSRNALRLPREASAKATFLVEDAYLKPRNTGAGDFFATVAVSGDTVVVGAPFEDSGSIIINGDGGNNKVIHSGAAYVFVRNSGKWRQQAYLKASDGAAGDQFGFAVAISGDTVVVGAYAAGDPVAATATTPATQTQYVGAAYVFTRSAAKWTQQQILKPAPTDADVGDAFGYSVAVEGNTAVIGAIGESTTRASAPGAAIVVRAIPAGAAYVFSRSGIAWTQQAYLKASKPEINDLFGIAVAVSGDTVVVGAPNESGNGKGKDGGQSNNLAKSSGAAYVFKRKLTLWKPQAYLKANNTDAGDQFGRAVGISGETVIVGAPGEASAARGVGGNQQNNGALKAGAAYLFGRTKAKWIQQAYLKASHSGAGDQFGFAVAISNDTAVVGAMDEDGGGKNAGAAHVYTRRKSVWSPHPMLRASNRGAGDKLGFSVGVSGETVVCGALGEASDAKTINGDQLNNRAKDAGASYVFENIRPVGPFIAVEQPAGTALQSGKAIVSFGTPTSLVPVSKTFSIVNKGADSLTGISVSVANTNLAVFSVDTTGMATSVLAGASTTFIVTFATASVDRQTATLMIRSNDKNESQFSIALQANGSGVPQIGLSLPDGTGLTDNGEAIDFGQVRIGATGRTREFAVLNAGDGTLKNLAISAFGPNPKDFSVTSLGVTELAPGETASFRVTFKPSARNKRTATIKIVSNDKTSGPFELNVSGFGTATSKGKKTVTPGLAEMVLGRPSSSPAAYPASSVEVIGGAKFLALTLTKPIAGGPVGTVQVSPNLLDWYSGSQHTTVILDDATTLKVRDNSPITPDTKRYIRIK